MKKKEDKIRNVEGDGSSDLFENLISKSSDLYTALLSINEKLTALEELIEAGKVTGIFQDLLGELSEGVEKCLKAERQLHDRMRAIEQALFIPMVDDEER
uniref:Uncharacterized protein n=1 Tax=Dictyoglomus turgidum TaxID=513050 RepID=A0A7C3SQW4_9BACT